MTLSSIFFSEAGHYEHAHVLGNGRLPTRMNEHTWSQYNAYPLSYCKLGMHHRQNLFILSCNIQRAQTGTLWSTNRITVFHVHTRAEMI